MRILMWFVFVLHVQAKHIKTSNSIRFKPNNDATLHDIPMDLAQPSVRQAAEGAQDSERQAEEEDEGFAVGFGFQISKLNCDAWHGFFLFLNEKTQGPT